MKYLLLLVVVATASASSFYGSIPYTRKNCTLAQRECQKSPKAKMKLLLLVFGISIDTGTMPKLVANAGGGRIVSGKRVDIG